MRLALSIVIALAAATGCGKKQAPVAPAAPTTVVPETPVNGNDPRTQPNAAPAPSDPCEGGEAPVPPKPKQ